MKCLIVKIKTGKKTNITYKKILSDKEIYFLPKNLTEALDYSPNTLQEENDWYKICSFSKRSFCIKLLKDNFSSVNYDELTTREIDKIDFLCSYQDDIYYFQNISKSSLKPKRAIHLGDSYSFDENSKSININDYADAIYIKDEDILYFQKISKITSIFKGIEVLYREATDEETGAFLNKDFIMLNNGFSADKVRTRNRQRIAIAMDTLSDLDVNDQKEIIDYITNYCPKLNPDGSDCFSIGSDDDLKYLLYGIEQRFYTTKIKSEKRIANSIIRIPND